ncbi:hypothetical protein ACH5RR_009886 [Cinchona calisaya]|uniref:Sialate O-acetylesterase domain-containing protein n=1 Tax=Cinchona calisaya TaxID=153742 RepID=A0ABD3AFM8_9GENT
MSAFLWLIFLAYASLVSTTDLNTSLVSTTDLNTNDYTSSLKVRRIFLLAGQSNMSRRGGVINNTWDGVIPLMSQSKPFKILRLSAGLTWVEAKEPLHQDIDVNATCGVGPGMVWMGTKISEWGRGTYLYNQLESRAKAAASFQDGGVSRIRALLWYQGESDTITPQDAKLYKKRVEKFFSNVRTDLKLPALPIIQVALASGQGPYVDKVRKAQFKVHLPKVTSIDAKGLPMNPDNLHLSTVAQVQLGEMFTKSFASIR